MKEKFISYTTIILCVLLILPFSIILVFKTPAAHSEEENRQLQQMPELNLQTLADATFMSGFSKYINDQFPFRNFFVGVKANLELAQLKMENNGVLLGKNGQLAIRNFTVKRADNTNIEGSDSFDPVTVQRAIDAINTTANLLDAMSIPFAAMLPPRTIDVAASAFSYPSDNSERLLNLLGEGLCDVNYVDVAYDFVERYNNGEYIYYKTDHHWTTLGAYYSYAAIMESFGLAPFSLDEFTVRRASDAFFGTTYSKGGFKFVEPDCIDFYDYNLLLPGYFTTTTCAISNNGYATTKSYIGLYDEAFLAVKDKYSAFLSGINTLTRIELTDGTPRQTLLLLSDSFGNSIAPFFALHFDVIMVNYNVFNDIMMSAGRNDALKLDTPDYVVFMYNLENIISTRNTTYLTKLPDLFK